MAFVRSKPPAQRDSSSTHSRTGSILFPDLVWAHWAWQRQARPHDFPPRGRTRRLFVRTTRLNGRPSPASKNGRTTSSPSADGSALREQFYKALDEFQNVEGEIVHAYWCVSEASAVALTNKTTKRRGLGWLPTRGVSDLRLHRETEWVTAEAPAIAELLHSGDTLAIRINRVLTPVPRRIAIEWVFSEQSYLLGFVERMGGRPSSRDVESTRARHQVEIDRIERYYDRAANKAARIRYFGGMLLGLGVVAVLGVLVGLIIKPFGSPGLDSDAMRNFYACFGAGALGAMVSVMTRMRQADGVRIDYEVGPALIVMLGSFRPVLGSIFGVLAYFALVGEFLNLTPPSGATAFFYYAVFAFAAGFSERFAHVILGRADLAVSKGLDGADTTEQEPVERGAPASAAKANGVHSDGREQSSRPTVGDRSSR